MQLKLIWPEKTRNRDRRAFQDFYLASTRRPQPCCLVETKEARGWNGRYTEKIKDLEARSHEKHFGDSYIVCLSDKGREMSSSASSCWSRFTGP